MKLLFYDLETTGIDYRKCAIIQLAAIVVEINTNNEMKALDAINLKMCPRSGKEIEAEAFEKNHLSLNEVNSWEDDSIAFKKFNDFLEKHVNKYDTLDKFHLAGYNNTHFDSDFLRQWFKDNEDKYFGSWFYVDQIDVMCEASRYLINYRPIIKSFRLGNIASILGIQVEDENLHDGMYDVKITYKLFKQILKSGNLILPFDEGKAQEIFDSQKKLM